MAIHDKRKGTNNDSIGEDCTDVTWTYRLEDGVCTDSLALVTAAKFGLSDRILKRANFLSEVVDEMGNVGESHIEKPVVSSYMTESNLNEKSKNTNGLGLEQAVKIAEEIIGENGKAIRIPPKWMAPASMEGCSCVYVLEIGYSMNDNERVPPRYYVGETDSLSRRLSQHRCKGKEWASLSAVAVRVGGGKTEARNVESLVIRKMAKAGYDLVSVSDGRSIRSNGSVNNTPPSTS
uniref:GIY-YIG domain-containing protein n=1 Tax=Ditylum brightwellii TaxID=49249 RepID=A0A7S4QI71_9STRA